MVYQHATRLLRTLLALLLSSTIFVIACEPTEEAEVCEDSEETPSAACQNAGMTLAAEGQCDQGSGVDCQRVSYCSGQLEALCRPMMVYCDPPLPEDICRSEGLTEAYGADCELVECQEVSYTSPCGDDVVLCKEAEEAPCELASNTFALCEERGLSLATEEECAELDCEAIEVEECGGTELVYCKTREMTSELTRESFIEAVAVAKCESLNDCCRSLELEMSQENCVNFFVARLAELPSFEVGQAMACLQEIEAAPRTCASFNADFMSCSALSNSQGGAEGAQPGESCQDDVDCASIDGADVYCDFDDNSETDELVCYAERRGAEGDACSSTCTEESSSESSCWSDSIDRSDYDTANCFTNDGLRCLDNVCAPLGVEGDFCLEPTECSTGFYCRRGFCTPSSSEGEACLDNSCALGLYCEMTTQTCVAALANGEMCAEVASSTTLCASGYCDTSGLCADANPAEEFSSLCEAFIE